MITLRSLTCISDSLCIPVTHKSKTRLNLFPFCKNNFSTNICNCDTTRKNCITKQNMYLYQACLLRLECQMHNKHLSPVGRKHS